MTSYASVANCELEWKRLNCTIDKTEGTDDDVPDTDSQELLVKRDAGYTQDVDAVDDGMESGWEKFKLVLMCELFAVRTAVEKDLDVSCEVLASRNDFQGWLTAAEEKVARVLRHMKGWKLNSVTLSSSGR